MSMPCSSLIEESQASKSSSLPRWKKYFKLFRLAASDWQKDNALRLGAALSYYTVFSLGPLLLLSIGIAGLWFGEQAARGELSGQLQQLVGPDGAQAIEAMVANAKKPSSGIIASIVGIVVLLVGATGVSS